MILVLLLAILLIVPPAQAQTVLLGFAETSDYEYSSAVSQEVLDWTEWRKNWAITLHRSIKDQMNAFSQGWVTVTYRIYKNGKIKILSETRSPVADSFARQISAALYYESRFRKLPKFPKNSKRKYIDLTSTYEVSHSNESVFWEKDDFEKL